MCIIAVCNHRRLTKREFEQCYRNNHDGVGYAYYLNNMVVAEKGFMSMKSAWESYKKVAVLPHVIHFRIGTAGGNTPELTHPFIVSKESPLLLNYCGDKPVLFHNGMIRDWESRFFEIVARSGVIPKGDISDSRVVSLWLAAFGNDIIRFFEGKYVVLRSDNIDVFGEGWIEENGVMFSNIGFVTSSKYRRRYFGSDDEEGYSLFK